MDTKLLYIMDPLCGWCYGNSQNMLRLEKELGDRVTIEVLPGGMWVDEGARYQSPELVRYIRPADARLRALTGVEMTEAYDTLLDDATIFLDSEPGCRAINVVHHLDPSLTLIFMSELARARYVSGLDTTILSTFLSIVIYLGLDGEAFRFHYESEYMRHRTREIFAQAREYAQAYPSLFVVEDARTVSIPLKTYHYDTLYDDICEYITS